MLPAEKMDTKIKPQGIEEGSFMIPKTRAVLYSEVEIQVVESNAEVDEGHAALAKEIVNIEEDSNNNEIVLDSKVNDSRE